MPDKLNILFAGSGAFGLPTLKALAERHEVTAVYTQPDRPAGRGKKLTPTPIAAWADQNGLRVIRTERFNDEPLPSADALVVIAFGQKISQDQANHPRLGSMNLHASLLPKYRGAAPIHHAIAAGERRVGNSVIRLAERMDAGAVLGQNSIPLDPTQTTGEIHDALAELGPSLVLRVLEDLDAGHCIEQPQNDDDATLAPKLSRGDALLNFGRPATMIAATINGLSPWPGCRVRVGDQTLTLLRARPLDGSGKPGQINDAGQIGTRDGLIEVLELQPEGKRPMSLADYRNGRPWPAGATVTPT